nr:uncharacterized protein LOC109781725 [Aegilops tauschii subsp. strangulata]
MGQRALTATGAGGQRAKPHERAGAGGRHARTGKIGARASGPSERSHDEPAADGADEGRRVGDAGQRRGHDEEGRRAAALEAAANEASTGGRARARRPGFGHARGSNRGGVEREQRQGSSGEGLASSGAARDRVRVRRGDGERGCRHWVWADGDDARQAGLDGEGWQRRSGSRSGESRGRRGGGASWPRRERGRGRSGSR